MKSAAISIEKMVIPTYPVPPHEDMPIFSENRIHQRACGRTYPSKVIIETDRSHKEDKEYTVVHMENDYLDIIILPEIGGRILAAKDKTTGYDFFYRQHVIKPALIGTLGPWISGGVEFNWPYHHTPTGFSPSDFMIETEADGSVVCWLSEHDPAERMKRLVGIVLRPDASYLETRVRLTNRTEVPHSFLWWENAAVPVNEQYQIFFPHDVTYVNFHYLDSRISYPIAGAGTYNGMDMTAPRDISWHKNTRDATSYFACASKYDFFGGYDHGKECGVVHIADHHISPGKKMFSWAYNQLSKSWEKNLTDTDGQYAELMAGVYTDNQPDFSWLEPYETKEFSQFWYPISSIGTPDYANLDCALHITEDSIQIEATRDLGPCHLTAGLKDSILFETELDLKAASPVKAAFSRPASLIYIRLVDKDGAEILCYQEEEPDKLKMPPVKDPMVPAAEMKTADELYLAGRHLEQYRDPAVMPDAYWMEALCRDPYHVPSLLGMAVYSYRNLRYEEALSYSDRALKVLTKYNARLENGDPYYIHALILEAMGRYDEAYDYYYKASWNGSAISKAMYKLSALDLRNRDTKKALTHAQRAIDRDADHPLAPAVKIIAYKKLGNNELAAKESESALRKDPFNILVRYLSDMSRDVFYDELKSDPAQLLLDASADLSLMGQYELIVEMLNGLIDRRPEEATSMVYFALEYYSELCGNNENGLLDKAYKAKLGNSYPSRAEEAVILHHASKKGSAYAKFLLGCLLYDKRNYTEGVSLFDEAFKEDPSNYIALRSLAAAYFSHFDKKAEALVMMKQVLAMHPSIQTLFETVVVMNKLDIDPKEKIELLTSHKELLRRGDILVELARAYNQAGEPDKALEVFSSHDFIPCEGGEHNIADQYMFAYYLKGYTAYKNGDKGSALEAFTKALTLPENLSVGIWNRCRYVPYKYMIAECLRDMGKHQESEDIYNEILGIEVEFFSNMYLPELPYYKAMSAKRLGKLQLADRIMGSFKQKWSFEISRKDSGYFSTTPFHVSFIDDPEDMRKAYYLYLLGLVELYCGHEQDAKDMFKESTHLNSDNTFCRFFALQY